MRKKKSNSQAVITKELTLIQRMGCHVWDAYKNFQEKESAVQAIYKTIGNETEPLYLAMQEVINDDVDAERKCYLIMTLSEAIDRIERKND